LKESKNNFLDHAFVAIFVDKYYNILLFLITYWRVASRDLRIRSSHKSIVWPNFEHGS